MRQQPGLGGGDIPRHDARRNENDELALLLGLIEVAERDAQDRDIAEDGNLADGFGILVRAEPPMAMVCWSRTMMVVFARLCAFTGTRIVLVIAPPSLGIIVVVKNSSRASVLISGCISSIT